MSRKEEILNDDVYFVGGKLTENIDAPNGVASVDDIESYRREFFNFITVHLVDELVKVEKTYPEDNKMDIKYSTEFVVLKKDKFQELINLKDE